jgi:hypothetical protein
MSPLAGMHFRGRNRDGQGDVSSSPDGGNGNDNGAGTVVDEEALPPAMVVESTRQQLHDENEEQQELVVQVPTNTNTTYTTQSFALPAITWELSEEAIALRREAIHREVR